MATEEPQKPNSPVSVKRASNGSTQNVLGPQIAWGEEYKAWTIERRLSYAERLASSMNHAADVLQTERNNLLDVCRKQEEKLKHAARVYLEQGELLNKELAKADVEKQELYKQIVDLGQQVKELKQAEKANRVDKH